MEDEEDFQALFFVECDENLADLQTRLDALLAGDSDPETVNAAFRAVHSVKGGAAAFGFEDLVGFAHDFETVMDRIRGGGLALSPGICETLLRAGDVMVGLVEATRAGGDGPKERAAQVTAQLAAVLGGAPPAAGEPQLQPKPTTGPVPQPDVPSQGEPAVVTVRLVPRPDFLLAGFDPARIIRAARGQGLVGVAVEGAVPPIQDYAPGDCPLAWKLEFELDGPLAALREFLTPYAYGADITVETAEGSEQLAPDTGPVRDQAPALIVEAEAARDHPEALKATGEPVARGPKAAAAPRSLRVDLDRVDRLVNLVGEVLIAQAAVAQGVADADSAGDLNAVATLVEALSRQTRELQESVMAIRAQPVRTVFARLPRLVRDLRDALGKEARLVLHGEEVEVDTTVIEELNEPLVHMIRNAMDHGLEPPDVREAAGKPRTGTLTLAAEQRGGRVRITLADDGRGIDRDAVLAKARAKGLVGADEQLDAAAIEALIFHPGFSTAQEVSAVSGRGVGMDVVRRNIQMLGGRCVVAGQPGQGTTFTITLPLTLAVMDGMAIRVDEQQFILPLSNVVEAVAVDAGRVSQLPDRSRVLKLRDAFLPVFSLRSALALPEDADGPATALVIDTETNGHVVVLVDDLLGQRQVVLKSLESNVGQIRGVSGATILGDGKVALVLDVPALFHLGPRSAGDAERIH